MGVSWDNVVYQITFRGVGEHVGVCWKYNTGVREVKGVSDK